MRSEIICIKASAGSGKTYQLALHYLKLLSSFEEVSPKKLSSIVAITFTNKAASEMKRRVLYFLKSIALGKDDDFKKEGIILTQDQAKEWVDLIINNYSDFHIRTIDSLLFAIFKALSFDFGYSPDLKVNFNLKRVFNEVFEEFMTNIHTEEVDRVFIDAMESYLKVDEREGFYPESGFKKRIFELFQKARRGLKTKNNERPYMRVRGYVNFLNFLFTMSDEFCKKYGIVLGPRVWTRMILDYIKTLVPLVYVHFGTKFMHFLFDEFQDTSKEQWDALFPLFENSLAEGGSIFLVGDIKQAIYGWRGGDWRLMEDVSQNRSFPSASSVKVKELKFNYRSNPKLVSVINSLFSSLNDVDFIKKEVAPVLLGNSDVIEEFSRSLSTGFKDVLQKSKKRSNDGIVSFYRVKGNKDEIKRVVKDHFINKIKEVWREYERRSFNNSPIAVLVRSNVEAEEISFWLYREGFTVITENSLKLSFSRLIKGVINCLQYFIEPENKRAFYGVLSSGLLEEGPRDEEELITAWISESISGWEEKLRLIREEVFLNREHLSLFDLVWDIIEAFNIWNRLDNDFIGQRPFIEKFLELAHEFSMTEGTNLNSLLLEWYKGEVEEKIGLPENINAIRVMTVHKAKGLEFPVVFIPYTFWYIKKVPSVEIYKDHVVYLKSNDLDEELKLFRDRLRAKEAQELINLFYVAITRAEERVYCYLTLTRKGLGPVSVILEKLLLRNGISCQALQ